MLYNIRKFIFEKSPNAFTSRKDQVTITRLRIGHTNLTHIYLITKTVKNRCKCELDIIFVHLLIKCTSYDKERQLCQVPDSLNEYLNQDGYTRTINFLKMISIYKLI